MEPPAPHHSRLRQFQKASERIILVWLTIALFNEFLFHIKPVRFFLLTEYAGFFAAGILIYRLRSGQGGLATLLLLALSLGVSLQTSMNSLRVIETNYQTPYSHGLVMAFIIALYGFFFLATSVRPSRISQPLLLTLGAITYPLYLIHQHIGYIAIARLKGSIDDPLLLVGVILAMLVAATIIWLLIDRPLVPAMRRGLRNLSTKMVHSAPQLAPYSTRPDVMHHRH